ncbi:MAG: GyrI-like domain-containing protein [Maribacter sp.]
MKKIILFIGIILLVSVVWYLFIKPNDYQVNFKVKTFPGTINQIIKTWNNTLDGSKMIEQESGDLLRLKQQIQFGDSIHIYSWHIIPETDSTSKVKVFIKDPQQSFKNKLTVPFSDTDFEKRSRKTLLDFNKKLNEHISNFKVKIIGKQHIDSTFCACTTQTTTQFGKARGMMKDFPLLDGFLATNGLKLNGRPFLEVTKWNMVKDSLSFNFCYPIIKSDTLPQHPDLNYKQSPLINAIKAEYNGNYITSDRAWYALLDYAKKNNLEVNALPIEVFHNNPNMGGEELKWKTEVYLPLKSD